MEKIFQTTLNQMLSILKYNIEFIILSVNTLRCGQKEKGEKKQAKNY